MVARGEIWWHESPGSKRRPHLVLTRNEGIALLNQVIAVPATTTIRDIPTEVRLGVADGMPTECVLSVDSVKTVRLSHLVERITQLPIERMREVCDALDFAIDCG